MITIECKNINEARRAQILMGDDYRVNVTRRFITFFVPDVEHNDVLEDLNDHGIVFAQGAHVAYCTQ